MVYPMTLVIDEKESSANIGTIALKSTINGMNVSLPTISPQNTELSRASKRKMTINSEMVTYNEHVASLDNFKENFEIVQSNYEEFAATHSSKIVNFSLDLSPKEKLDKDAVEKIRLIQIDATSPFLFEYETNLEQDVDSLNIQLEKTTKWLLKKESQKILVPVIDIGIREEGLFREKLESLSKTYKRINVIYRTPNQAPANWADLKSFLKDNEIWCHMDCVLNRYNNERIAHRVRFYSIGILSTSLGYPFGGSSNSKKKKRILDFNPDTHRYEIIDLPHEPSFAEQHDRTWINSLNKEITELEKMREHVTKKSLYTKYIPTKDLQYLTFTEGI